MNKKVTSKLNVSYSPKYKGWEPSLNKKLKYTNEKTNI